jgi:ferredoxin
MPYIITDLCTRDGSCVDVCPVACIHTTPDAPQFYIDPEVCIECEQCEIVCPVDAIFLDYKLPEEKLFSIEVNAAFFRQNKAAMEPPSVDKAFDMIRGAERYAGESGLLVAVAVVDEAGSPIAVSRMDGAAPWAAEVALARAKTAAGFWLATHQMRTEVRRPWFRSLSIASRGGITGGGGGFPILDGPVVVGAIGVAGSGADEDHVLCCRAGVTSVEVPTH